MDGNKDEALNCLKIAKDSILSGDKNRALRFINKARRLDPSIEIDDLLSNLNTTENNCSEPSESPKQPDNGPRRRVSSAGQSASAASSSVAYTEEQVVIVREIKRKKDYYEILGLEKTCSVEDVKKAYRKLSLKVHPDKNKAPGAEEAFKIVSRAFQCLSDEESRKKYDLVGSDEPVYETRQNPGGMQGFNGFYDGDIDADEIFRNFFFGGMHPVRTTQFRGFSFGTGGVGVRMGPDRGSNGSLRALIQVLVVVFVLLMNFFPFQQPLYSLSNSYPYEHRFTTQKGVNYYVKSGKFEQEYAPGSSQRVELEQQVDNEYHSVISHNCRVEMQNYYWGYRRETPNCDALKRFEISGR